MPHVGSKGMHGCRSRVSPDGWGAWARAGCLVAAGSEWQRLRLVGAGSLLAGGVGMPGHERAMRRARAALRRSALGLRAVGVCAVVALAVVLVLLVADQRGRVALSTSTERLLRIQRHVAALFAGIPQHGVVLGQPTAPVTLQVFVDLEDGDGKLWFNEMLPSIIEKFVRTNVVRLELRSF